MRQLNEYIAKDGFRLRGTEMSRIDGFSDVVFGFALTLLVVSLEVPRTYAELHHLVQGFFPFAISFLFLMMIWFGHFQFFRRFGLHDTWTITLNAMLLFVVLFYVYPLKFLFTLVIAGMVGGAAEGALTEVHQIPELMVLYGGGFTLVYLLLAALYWNAWRQRDDLGLNSLERVLARGYIVEISGVAGVGLLSCLVALALPPEKASLAGWIYMLIGVFKTFHGRKMGQKAANLRDHGAGEMVDPTL